LYDFGSFLRESNNLPTTMYLMFLGLPMLFFWSLAAFLTPFGWLRALPLAAAAVGIVYFRRRDARLALGIGAWAALTYLLDLLAWWLSPGPLEPGRGRLTWVGLQSDGVAGFPWRALELPPGAMGGDQPTAEQWGVVMVNLGCWGAVAAVAVIAILALRRSRHNAPAPLLPGVLLATAFVLNQFLVATFMLWFD
jgi:hypothetical protein